MVVVLGLREVRVIRCLRGESGFIFIEDSRFAIGLGSVGISLPYHFAPHLGVHFCTVIHQLL